jgi:hypothetical protein
MDRWDDDTAATDGCNKPPSLSISGTIVGQVAFLPLEIDPEWDWDFTLGNGGLADVVRVERDDERRWRTLLATLAAPLEAEVIDGMGSKMTAGGEAVGEGLSGTMLIKTSFNADGEILMQKKKSRSLLDMEA